MDINIEYVHLKASDRLTDHINEQLSKLNAKYDWLIGAQVYLKKEADKADAGKICEIKLSLPGPQIFASSKEESFEMAINRTCKDLDKQLTRRKEEQFNARRN